jgi:hypothetical protein
MLDYFRILQGLQIDEGSLVVTGTIDPSVTGYAADEGSLFLRNNPGAGQLWLKTGAAATAWSSLGAGSGNAYTTITGDAGSATASTSTDTLNFTGVGITTSVADGAPDTVTLTLNIADLVAGVGPLVLGDEIAVNDGGTTLRFTFTDVVEDLDIPYGITANGLITRTAADTYASRTIIASTNEDELGIILTNGSGVAGDPAVGLDIVGLTDPNADMAATDEFPLHDKSEGTAGANRKITGQNIADGVFTIAGFTGFTMSTIDGQLVPTFTDTTRANKQLSFAESVFSFSDNVIGDDDWLDIGNATEATTGHIVPLTGTIVRASFQCADDNGNTKDLDLYINGIFNATLFTTSGSSGEETGFDAALNIDVAQGDKIQIRGDAAGGSIDDTVVDVWIKWRA